MRRVKLRGRDARATNVGTAVPGQETTFAWITVTAVT